MFVGLFPCDQVLGTFLPEPERRRVLPGTSHQEARHRDGGRCLSKGDADCSHLKSWHL